MVGRGRSVGSRATVSLPPPRRRRRADIYGLHRNLGLFLITSFEIASEKVRHGWTEADGRGGGVTSHRQVDSTHWILAWQRV